MADTERRFHHGTCLSCGGKVDDAGYAFGGEIDGDEDSPTDEFGNVIESPHEVSTTSVQQRAAEEMRDAAFASSLRGGRR